MDSGGSSTRWKSTSYSICILLDPTHARLISILRRGGPQGSVQSIQNNHKRGLPTSKAIAHADGSSGPDGSNSTQMKLTVLYGKMRRYSPLDALTSTFPVHLTSLSALSFSLRSFFLFLPFPLSFSFAIILHNAPIPFIALKKERMSLSPSPFTA